MEEEKTRDEIGDNSSIQEDHFRSTPDVQIKDELILSREMRPSTKPDKIEPEHPQNNDRVSMQESDNSIGNQTVDKNLHEEKEAGLVIDGIETPKLGDSKNSSKLSVNPEQEGQFYDWPEKAVALTNLVKEKSAVAVSTLIRRLSGKKDEDEQVISGGEEMNASVDKGSHEDEEISETNIKDDSKDNFKWNPLNFIKIPWDLDMRSNTGQESNVYSEHPKEELLAKGRIIVYTKLQCQESKDVRLFMHQKKLKYIEINVDIYPSRKLELEKITGSSDVPRIYFNDLLIGGLSEMNDLNESGKIDEKISYVINEEPSPAAPLPPLSGEDDVSGGGVVDESATIVRKMKKAIVLGDRFYKMRRFSNCFLGSEAVDFLSEDQYLERDEAVEFGRKLVDDHFFQHVLDENLFEDSNHLYRFLEDDPVIINQCYNIPKGLLETKAKPINEIASRLRILSYAIFEAYVSEDGKHVDYKSLNCSEEFKRYLRIVEELHRVKLNEMSREDSLSFFINLYNMMTIHAILTWGYPVGTLDRRKFVGDFKYFLSGSLYSLSAIYNGILRANQRPPYTLTKIFGAKDKRAMVSLPYPEPLVHFALVCGARSAPALRCYSPGNIDQELIDAARNFLRNGGIFVDTEAKVVSVSKILKWFSVDFGNNEIEVIKHAANYLEASKTGELLELLANNNAQLKVTYQSYDWSLNY